MDLTYHLTREDHWQGLKLARARVASRAKGPLSWKGATVLSALASWLLTVIALDQFFRSHVIDARAFVAACLAYVWGLLSMALCGWFWQQQYLTNWFQDDSVSLGELRLKIDGDGIECVTRNLLTKYSWHAFCDISEHDDLVVLWLDRGQGLVVPAGAFVNQETRRLFVSLVREHIAPAPSQPTLA
jgi:hypothetical protein